jgi:hypothetical protein
VQTITNKRTQKSKQTKANKNNEANIGRNKQKRRKAFSTHISPPSKRFHASLSKHVGRLTKVNIRSKISKNEAIPLPAVEKRRKEENLTFFVKLFPDTWTVFAKA